MTNAKYTNCSHCQMKKWNNRYSVVGFGSDAYDRPLYCTPAIQIDRNMHKLGARMLQPMCLVSDTYVFHDFHLNFKVIQNESVLQVSKVRYSNLISAMKPQILARGADFQNIQCLCHDDSQFRICVQQCNQICSFPGVISIRS